MRHGSLPSARTDVGKIASVGRTESGMREKLNIPEETIAACLRIHYGLKSRSIRFLPIGYDLRAFVYEVITSDGNAWFVKIRDGAIHPPGLLVPRVLIEAGIPHILAPLRTRTQELW